MKPRKTVDLIATNLLSTHPNAGGLMKRAYSLPVFLLLRLSTHPNAGGLMKLSTPTSC